MADGGNVAERFDLEAERAMLGVLLLEPKHVPTAMALARPADMYRPGNGVIFETILGMFMASQPIDVVTVSAALRAAGRLDTVGGSQYLGELQDYAPTANHIEAYAKIIAKHAAARRMLFACAKTISAGHDASLDADALIDEGLRLVNHAAESRPVSSEPQMIDVSINEMFEELEKAGETGQILTGLKTGLRDLDTLTAGMHDGEVSIVAARPSVGKTAFALAVSLFAAQAKPVLFYSYEMPRKALTRRLVSMASSVPHEAIRTAQISSDNMRKLSQGAQRIYQLPLMLEYNPSATVFDIAAHARHLKARKGLGLVVVDYLQLVAPVRHYDSREREVSEISKSLKKLAGELNVPVIALSQLNRRVETRGGKKGGVRPELSDLRESGSIEQDADVVIFLHRETKQSRECEAIVAKQRNGPCETVMINYVPEFTRFENVNETPPDNNWTDPESPHAN